MALVRTVSAATTISPQDGILIEQVATTITLPAATAFPVGQVVSIKNNSGGSVTVTPASGNIDAAASNTLTNLSHIAVATDGTNYFIVG
jgi:virulence-associated protein VagC